jgi:YaiO family outer membrane protein
MRLNAETKPVAALATVVIALCAAHPAYAQHAAHPDDLPARQPETPAATEIGAAPIADLVRLFGNFTASEVDFGPTQQTWTLAEAGAVVPLAASRTIIIGVQHEQRTSGDYWRVEGRIEGGSEQRLSYYVGAAAGMGDPIRENWSLSAGVRKAVSPRLTLTLDTRIARYDSLVARGGPATFTATPGVLFSPRGTGLVLSGRWINFWDVTRTHRQGYAVDASWYYGDADFVFAGLARYPETDSGVTRTMRATHLGVRHQLNRRLSLRLSAEQLERAGSYRKQSLTLGLELRF